MAKISVVLPTFNEVDNILVLIGRIEKQLSARQTDYEILVVDDNSPDKTWKVVDEYSKTHARIRLIHRLTEKGLTSALNRGLDEAKGDIAIWMDCDLSHPPELINELLDQLNVQNADAVIASRYAKGGEDRRGGQYLVQKFLSLILSKLFMVLIGVPVRDVTSGFLAIKLNVLRDLLPLRGDYGEYFIDMVTRLNRRKKKMIEIPYITKNREFGESKTATNLWGYFRRGIKYLGVLLMLRFEKEEIFQVMSVPANEPLLNGREKELLNECIDTGWISSDGPFVAEFENKFAQYIGMKYGVAVCNGSVSLEAALHAAGVGPGDEVILPTFTIITCATAIVRLGAKPVLVDIEPKTWNMDVRQIEAKITPKTKAIMPVHIYGHPVDMDPLLDLAKKYKLMVVEDAAEVHGAEYKGKKAGSMGQLSSFSFYANKIITTGEGGMVLTNDPVMAEKVRSYRNLYFQAKQRFLHEELGYNFRMTNLQAALGLAQLERIQEFIEIKIKNAALYRKYLDHIPGVRFQEVEPWAKSVYWMYSLEIDSSLKIDAKEAMKRLSEFKIGSRPFFLGLHRQPAFHKRGLFLNEHYPNADRASERGFYLPSGFTLTEKQIRYVCQCLGKVLKA